MHDVASTVHLCTVSTAKPRCGRVSPVLQNRFQLYKLWCQREETMGPQDQCYQPSATTEQQQRREQRNTNESRRLTENGSETDFGLDKWITPLVNHQNSD